MMSYMIIIVDKIIFESTHYPSWEIVLISQNMGGVFTYVGGVRAMGVPPVLIDF